MKLGVWGLVLGFWLFGVVPTQADSSIYDVVNNEDMDTFSDMVILGYDIDDTDADGFSPLMIASALGKPTFVQFLIDNNAKVDKRSYKGLTALHRAAQAGHNEIVNILVEAGANVNMPDFDGNTPLMLAVASNRRFTAELLVKLGTDINFRNAKGETAYKIAEKRRFKEIMEFLKENGGR